MFISLGNCQFSLDPANNPLSQKQGESLIMQWNMVDKTADYLTAILYLGRKQNKSQVLYTFSAETIGKGSHLSSHFGNRSMLDIHKNTYTVKINDLQYSNAGSYLLRVVIDSSPIQEDQEVITIKVLGKYGIICFQGLV